jgi:hypothetical protein
MGRKALEEGTAIAVVHEVVDGNGRRGEAIQRMVGQSKGSRRESSTTNLTDLKEKESLQRAGVGDEVEEDDDSMSVGTSWSYSNPHHNHSYSHPQSQSYPHYQQHHHQNILPPLPPPPAANIIHNEYSAFPSHHTNLTYPSAASPPNRSTIGAYSSAPQYRMQSYKHGSPSYFSTHDYFPSKYPTGHFDTARRGSANGLMYMPQSEANRAATAAARRFYSATTSLNDHSPRSPRDFDPTDHKRAYSFGTAQQSRPQLQANRQEAWSASPPLHERVRPEANEIKLPPPSVSKVPYSSDRSTSDRMPTTPKSEDRLSSHLLHSASDAANGSLAYQNDRRTLAPLHGALRK